MARSNRYSQDETKMPAAESETSLGEDMAALAAESEPGEEAQRLKTSIEDMDKQIRSMEAELEAVRNSRRELVEKKHRLEINHTQEDRVSALKRASDLLSKDPNAVKSAEAGKMRQMRQQLADLAEK